MPDVVRVIRVHHIVSLLYWLPWKYLVVEFGVNLFPWKLRTVILGIQVNFTCMEVFLLS